MEWAKVEYQLFKKLFPEEKLLCTAYTPEALDDLGVRLDVRVSDLWRLSPEDMKRAEKEKNEVWGLRWLCQYNTYEFPRHFAGFGLDRMGLDGFTEWTYYGAPLYRPYDQMVHFPGCHYSFTDEKGNLLNTIPWEASQEGIDDSRYVATLRELIDRGSASSDAKQKMLAGVASKKLDKLIAGLPYRPKIVSETELARLRGEIAGELLQLIRSGITVQ